MSPLLRRKATASSRNDLPCGIRWAVLGLALGTLCPSASVAQSRDGAVVRQGRPAIVEDRSERGWMGVSVNVNVTSDGTGPEETVIRVLRTVDGSPAQRAGMRSGDLIERIAGQPLTLREWERLTGNMAIGDEVSFGLRGTDGELRTIVLTAGPRPDLTLPAGVSDRLEAVRESFEARLESSQDVWASRDHVRLLISGDSVEVVSNRILDQARRNAVAYGARSRVREAPPTQPEPFEQGEVTMTLGPDGVVWSFGRDSVHGWSGSESTWSPSSAFTGRYSVVLNAESALPFEYLLLSSQEADSLKTAVIQLRSELNTLNEATRLRERELVEIMTQQARELGETDVSLIRLRSDNDRVYQELAQVAARLAEVGSLEREDRAMRQGTQARDGSVMSHNVGPVTAGLVGRNFVGGAQFSDLNPRLSQYFGTDRGVLVIDVLRGTPAFEAGLLPGDVVVRVANSEVESLVAFRAALKEVYARDRSAVLAVVRKGQPLLVTLSR